MFHTVHIRTLQLIIVSSFCPNTVYPVNNVRSSSPIISFTSWAFATFINEKRQKAVSRKEPMNAVADRVLIHTLLKIRTYVKGATFPPYQVQRNGVAFGVPVRMCRWYYNFGTDRILCYQIWSYRCWSNFE